MRKREASLDERKNRAKGPEACDCMAQWRSVSGLALPGPADLRRGCWEVRKELRVMLKLQFLKKVGRTTVQKESF